MTGLCASSQLRPLVVLVAISLLASAIDAASTTFDSLNIADIITRNKKFGGAAATGDLVVFAPYSGNCIGVYTPASNNFACYTIEDQEQVNYLNDYKFKLATTAANGKVVFPPFYADCVGVLDTNYLPGCSASGCPCSAVLK